MASVTLQLYTVDSFTDVPFKGNPAAICPLPSDVNLDDDILQKIAVEMNLSETAFIKLIDKSDSFKESNTFGLRWFTPKDEIKLCGHATLASAAVLFGKLDNKHDRIVFKTLSGDLIVKREGEWIHMDFPVGDAVKEDQSQNEQLLAGMYQVLATSSTAIPCVIYLYDFKTDGQGFCLELGRMVEPVCYFLSYKPNKLGNGGCNHWARVALYPHVINYQACQEIKRKRQKCCTFAYIDTIEMITV